MTDQPGYPGDSISQEMSEYLQVFMDETDEQLEGLTEALLVLEQEPESVEHLNEAFRLIHSIKGSAGMMGLDSIAALTHHLESRFEHLRSGATRLDESTMNLVLRCIDFLRECVKRLRAGEPLGSAGQLLRELSELGEHRDVPEPDVSEPTEATEPRSAPAPIATSDVEDACRLVVRFEPGLRLLDLKVRLILSRLSHIGDVVSARPPADELEGIEDLTELQVVIVTEKDAAVIRAAADVDGVEDVQVVHGGAPVAAAQRAPAPEPEAELELKRTCGTLRKSCVHRTKLFIGRNLRSSRPRSDSGLRSPRHYVQLCRR